MASAAPLPTLQLPALDNTFGAIFVGAIVAAGLWGIGTAQAYWYYSNYTRDKLSLRIFVAVVWAVDTVQQALISHILYFYVITNYFNPLILDYQVWSLDLQSLFEALTSAAVQSFFVIRIWRLSNGNYPFVVLPTMLVIAKFVVGIVYVAQGFTNKSITIEFIKYHRESLAINALAAGGDIVIAASMTWLLYRARTGFGRSDTLLGKLMIYTINTGLITSLCAIITLITAKVWPKAFIYGAFYFITGRLYVNTMLASLNARSGLAGKENVISMSKLGGDSHNLSSMTFAAKAMTSQKSVPTFGTQSTTVGDGQNVKYAADIV